MNTKQNNTAIKYFTITTMVISTLSFGAPIFAETTGTTATGPRAAKVEALQTANMSRLKTRGEAEIDRRVAALGKVLDQISRQKRLSADQKTALTTEVQSEIDILNALKAKIEADTDITTLRADVQSIVKSYRVFALYIPQMYIIVHADRILDVADDMTALITKLQARVTEAKNAGKDTTNAQTALDDATAKIADAKTQAQNAITAVTPLTPEGYPENKTTLQNARTMLQTARADLRTALHDAQQVRQLLRGMKITPTPTP